MTTKRRRVARAGSFASHGRMKRKAAFLIEMNVVVPSSTLSAPNKPRGPTARNRRRPIGMKCLLRLHFLK